MSDAVREIAGRRVLVCASEGPPIRGEREAVDIIGQALGEGASWAALPVAERVLQVWRLSEAQYRLRGDYPDASGLPRSVARVHRP